MSCPVCSSTFTEQLLEVGNLPTSVNRLTASKFASQNMQTNHIEIYQCKRCTHVFNPFYRTLSYDVGCNMYNKGAAWQKHMQYEAARLLDAGGKLVEIGAGSGEFAEMVGADVFEPSQDVEQCVNRGLNVVDKFFIPSVHMPLYQDHTTYILRHVLEHFIDPQEFLTRMSLQGGDTELMIEVPCIDKALEECRFEDWVYEHPQHFTIRSLATLLYRSGWFVNDLRKAYGGEVLVVNAKPKDWPDNRAQFNLARIELAKTIAELKNKPVAYWGGAGKSMMLLRALKVADDALVVDSDPNKVGMYVPGTGIKIRDPQVISKFKPYCTVITTKWRAADIIKQAAGLPCGAFYTIEKGKLCRQS